MSKPVCPYCRSQVDEVSRDHIFPDFLGGTRKIPACEKCNHFFGSTFESKAARQLLSFQLMLRAVGISQIPIEDGRRWVRSYEHEGELHDIEFRNGKIVVVPSQPKLIRNKDGEVVAVRVRSMKEAKSQIRRMKGNHEVEIQESRTPVRLDEFNFGFEFSADFGQLVAKMCVSLSSLMPGFAPRDVGETADLLKTGHTRVDDVRRDFRPLDQTDQGIPLLSHRIYVERTGGTLRGRVTFFGVIRMYCVIRGGEAVADPGAIMATLNVVNGEETFEDVDAVGLSEAPLVIANANDGATSWARQLAGQIEAAGVQGMSVAFGKKATSPVRLNWSSKAFGTTSTLGTQKFSATLRKKEADD